MEAYINGYLERMNAEERAELEAWLSSLVSREDDSAERSGGLAGAESGSDELEGIGIRLRGVCRAELPWAVGPCVNPADGPDGACEECRAELLSLERLSDEEGW